MGLAEKRERKAAEDGWLPRRQAELEALAGAAIPYEVDWDSFEGDAKALNWLESNGPHQVNSGLRVICKDELGKEAVVEAVKKVLFRNVGDPGEKKLALEGGVLLVQCAYSRSPGGRFGYPEIQKYVEGQL